MNENEEEDVAAAAGNPQEGGVRRWPLLCSMKGAPIMLTEEGFAGGMWVQVSDPDCAVVKDAPIMPFVEECALCMAQLLECAAVKDAPIEPFVEECALCMVPGYAEVKVAPIKPFVEECALGMVQESGPTVNAAGEGATI